MKHLFQTLFFALLFTSGFSYLFYQEHAIERKPKKASNAQPKVSKVELSKSPPKVNPPKRLLKNLALEKPASVSATPFAGMKSYGSGNSGNGMISHADQMASASNSFSSSKSQQTSDAQILSKSEPLFPENAKKKNITGFVRLLITIDQNATVKSIDIIEANPEGYFETAAIEAVKSWKFAAAFQNGSPVESSMKRKIEFKLE